MGADGLPCLCMRKLEFTLGWRFFAVPQLVFECNVINRRRTVTAPPVAQTKFFFDPLRCEVQRVVHFVSCEPLDFLLLGVIGVGHLFQRRGAEHTAEDIADNIAF